MTEKSSPSKSSDQGDLRKWLWDSERKAFLGRTGTNWVQLLVFYAIFYTCLAAFWALSLVIFMQTIDFKEPKWQQDYSRIGANPGLGFRPRPAALESGLIQFKGGATGGNYDRYVEDLDNFIKPYEQDSGDAIGRGETVASTAECSNPNNQPPKGKFCPFNFKELRKVDEACTSANKFGYSQSKPCVLIKINKIYGWVPKPFSKTPDKLTKSNFTGDATAGVVITCDGETGPDREAIGNIRYTPSQIIPARHFPYTNQQGYLPPFVMVQFEGPTHGKAIGVECRAWAENMRYNRKEGEGSVHFELYVE